MITLISWIIPLLFNYLSSIFVKLYLLIFNTTYWVLVSSRMFNEQRLAAIPIANQVFLIELLSGARRLSRAAIRVIDFAHQELNIGGKYWEPTWENTTIRIVKLHASKVIFMCLWRAAMWIIMLLDKTMSGQS